MMKNIRTLYLRYKFIIWPLTSGLAFLVILILVIWPQFSFFWNDKKELSDLKGRSGVLEAKAQTLENIDEGKSQDDLKVVFTFLPKDQDAPQSFETLQKIIENSGLGLKETTFAGGSAGSRFQLNITVIGSMISIREFLVKLQDAPQLFRIESISATFSKDGGVVEASIPISVFYEPIPKDILTKNDSIQELSGDEIHLLSQLSRLTSSAATPEEDEGSVPSGKLDPFE